MFKLIVVCLLVVTFVESSLSDLEKDFLSIPRADLARSHLYNLTAFEHLAGTPGDFRSAQYVLDAFTSFGIQAEIEPFRALVSYPVRSALAVVDHDGDVVFKAKLSEEILDFDKTSDSYFRNHTFHGYAPSGNVTSRFIYANYGRIEDFDYLTKNLSLDLSGAIAVVRYGQIFRGLKVRHAQMHGMKGVVIYSDPADDGELKGDTYPNGPWRPKFGVQRGSVQFNSICAGDPGLIERDPEICGMKTEELIPQITSIPISAEDAKGLFEYGMSSSIHGSKAPDSWKGGLDVEYVIKFSDFNLNLDVENKFEVRTLWNVVGRIEGLSSPNEYILIGNHRDAWVYGAADPNSGTSTLLEVSRSFSELIKKGWKPRRTIILLSWDGEEYGLLGSTFHGEKHAQDYSQNAVAYLNLDVAVRGYDLLASMTPSLYDIVEEATYHIKDPRSGKTLHDVWDKKARVLGSGSDYTVFLDYLGIPSMDFKFDGLSGTYHSVYDSFSWMDKFVDPGFLYHRMAAQLLGLIALKLIDNEVLPIRYDTYTHHLSDYAHQIEQLYSNWKDVSELLQVTEELEQIGKEIEVQRQILIKEIATTDFVHHFNRKLFMAERQFLLEEGLPWRKYFKHCIQAPGISLGYGAQVFPGLQDARYFNDAKVADDHLNKIIRALQNFGDFLQSDDNIEKMSLIKK